MLAPTSTTIAATWGLCVPQRTPEQGVRRRIVFRTPTTNAGVCYIAQDTSLGTTKGIPLYAGEVYLDEVDNSGKIWQGNWFVVGTAADVINVIEET